MAFTNAEKQARHRARHRGIVPEQADIEVVEAAYGRLLLGAPVEQQAERYRLYQAQALIRLWKNGQLPLDQMRAMDALQTNSKQAED
jgi:hypothetical protein